MASSGLLRALIIAASATQAVASCAYGTHLAPRAEEGAEVKVNTFGYTGTIGPLNWAALDAGANGLCATGTRQSPIDMVDGVFHLVSAADVTLEIPDMAEGTEFENLGTTVEVIAANGGKLVVGEKEFALQQFHFHLPSEHLDNGTSIAMEMHMVWESAAQEIAVVGVFVDLDNGAAAAATAGAAVQASPAEKKRRDVFHHPHARRQEAPADAASGAFGGVPGMLTIPSVKAVGVSSTLLETVFTKVEEIATPGTAVKTDPLVMSELVSTLLQGGFQAYSGSLTTPPCSENVMWLVATQKLQIQTATFEKVRNVIGFNARFPQNTPGAANLLQVGAAAAAAVQSPVAAAPAAAE